MNARLSLPLPVLFRRFSPYLLAVITLAVLGLSAWMQFRYPYDGMNVSLRSGLVNSVDPTGPAAGRVEPGDVIQSVDGSPFLSISYLSKHRPGDPVIYVFYHHETSLEGETYKAKLTLASPPLSLLWQRLSPLLVALSFWILGVLVVALSRTGDPVFKFFLFSQMITAVLGAGSLSTLDVLWARQVFAFLLWWIGPLAVHTHMSLADSDTRRRRIWVGSLYLLALIFSVSISLNWGLPPMDGYVWPSYLWLGLTLLLSILVLGLSAWRSTEVEARRKLGLLALSALAGFLPFILLSLLPEALFGRPALTYQTSFLAMPILPLGYSYAILRYRLLRLERYVNRSAAYALAITLIASLYAMVYLAAPQLMPGKDRRLTALGLVVVVALIFLAHPLYRLMQRLVNRIFYGGWYDDRAAVKQISQALGQVEGDSTGIAATLCRALLRTMQLEHAGLLLAGGQIVAAEADWGPARIAHAYIDPDESDQILRSLTRMTGREAGRVQDLAPLLPLSDPEKKRLLGKRPHLWLLLNGLQGPLGLLILGERRGVEFDGRDLEILEVVIHQAKVALENAALLEEVRQHSQEIRRLHRRALQAREEERKRVARELHDRVIQALVGLNYQLSGLQTGDVRSDSGSGAARGWAEISQPAIQVESKAAQSQPIAGIDDGRMAEIQHVQDGLRRALSDLRQVCANLRPPALDVLGLLPALQSRVAELQTEVPFVIRLHVHGDEERELPETAALCLYRVFQEAMMNARKHSGASQVDVRLDIQPASLTLTMQDNGQGCRLPSKLSLLAQEQHFGLIGLQEMVEAVQGELQVESAPGKGYRLSARLPLK